MRKQISASRPATESRTPGAATSPTRPGRRPSSWTRSGSDPPGERAAGRLVPLEEETGGPTVRYADWQAIGKDRWVPRRIDVLNGSVHYRMSFAWLGDLAWLLRSSESIAPEATLTLTRTRNVIANGR